MRVTSAANVTLHSTQAQGTHAPPLSFDPDTFLTACIAWPFLPDPPNPHTSTSSHFLAEREENRLKIQYYNWTPKISPLDKWQHDWIASGGFGEGANSSRHTLRCLVPSTLQQLVGAFSSPRQINSIQCFHSWQPRHRHRHRPLLPPAPPPPQPSNPQHHNHMSSGTNAGTTHQPH